MDKNSSYFDKFLDYSIVIEQTVDPDKRKIEIIDENKGQNGTINWLRFRACLHTFKGRNRNRRLWVSKWTRPMFEGKEVKELLSHGGVPGENGHPVPDTGSVTIERILTIDPNNISHRIVEYQWPSDNECYGIIDTIYDENGPGNKFKCHIMQGLPTSFSTRSLIPQRKNPDGSIDQTGPGRYVTSDRVFIPGFEDAYIDVTVPVKNVCKQTHFQQVMESYTSFVVERSEKINRIIDNMDPALESATISENGILSMRTADGIVGIYPELKYRREISDIMRNL